MRIDLHTYCDSTIDLELFINWYLDKVPSITITIHDKDSLSEKIEIYKSKGCIIKSFYYVSVDDWKNNCWKNKPSDCIVLVEPDEYLNITYNVFNNCSMIISKGYEISDILDLNSAVRNPDYDKCVMFDPRCILNTNFEREYCNPSGMISFGEIKPELYKLC
jgi:hypothetical protein